MHLRPTAFFRRWRDLEGRNAPLHPVSCLGLAAHNWGKKPDLLLGPFRWPQTPIEQDVPSSCTSRKELIDHRFKPVFCKLAD
ncbi:hypothetical protein NIES30_12070 [Phormidium tenue NIES-30]|uniref:Uncharacterized protein n=1 Tax=Phormidium tenue NIES-30 TaxID=549789 RepID=A0A1U7J537_9CYAN|nr:hypothetical protein NIES30_12070 [Phormidium tenue NIES-30]